MEVFELVDQYHIVEASEYVSFVLLPHFPRVLFLTALLAVLW